MPVTPVGEDIRFRLQRLVQHNPDWSQRPLARILGAFDCWLRALMDKGAVKARNLRVADNNRRYAYVLTPRGIAQNAALIHRFFARKIAEFAALMAEIATLERDINSRPGGQTDRGPGMRQNRSPWRVRRTGGTA